MGNTFMTALNIYNVRHLKDIISKGQTTRLSLNPFLVHT